MATYTETIELQDDVSRNAEAAAGAVGDLERGLLQAQKEMFKMNALGDDEGLIRATGNAMKFTEALGPAREEAKKWTDQLGAMNKNVTEPIAEVAKAAEVVKAPVRTFGDALAGARDAAQAIAPHLQAAAAGLKEMGSAIVSGDVGGAIVGLGDALAGVAGLLDLVVPGLGQAVGTIIKIGAGVAGLAASLVQAGMMFAIEAAAGKEAFIGMAAAMLGSRDAGEKVDEMLDDLAKKSGIAKDTLEPLTANFIKLGITSKDALEKATLAAISAEAIAKGGAAGFENLFKKVQLAAQTTGTIKIDNKLIKGLAESGLTVDDLAKGLGTTADKLKDSTVDAKKLGDAMQDALIKKGAGPLENMGLTLDNMKKQFMGFLADMFEDIDVKPLLKEVKALFGIFDTGQASGATLKSGIQAFFQKTFDIAAKLVPVVKHLAEDLIIMGLQAYIALKPAVKALNDAYTAVGGNTEAMKQLSAVWDIVKPLIVFVAVSLGLVVAAFGFVVIGIMQTIAALTWLGGVFASIYSTLGTWASGAVQIATDFVMGLVNGITAGAQWVIDAVKGLATGALGAFKSVLGIASPSKVMLEMGMQTGAGFAGGMDLSANDVYGSAASLSGAATAGVASGGDAAGASSSTTNAPSISVVIQMSGDGKGALEITEEMVAAVWERYALGAA